MKLAERLLSICEGEYNDPDLYSGSDRFNNTWHNITDRSNDLDDEVKKLFKAGKIKAKSSYSGNVATYKFKVDNEKKELKLNTQEDYYLMSVDGGKEIKVKSLKGLIKKIKGIV
jgi:hypothetical protein